jgi:hypothetical protein
MSIKKHLSCDGAFESPITEVYYEIYWDYPVSERPHTEGDNIMKCQNCDGEGYFEVDCSYYVFSELHEVWEQDRCEECYGTGEVDKNDDNDVNLYHE